MQWVDGAKRTGGDGTGSDDRGMKSAGDGSIVERGTPQLNVQELAQEQWLTLYEHETQEALSEHEGGTQGALSELEEETQEALSERERQQHKMTEGDGTGNDNRSMKSAGDRTIVERGTPQLKVQGLGQK